MVKDFKVAIILPVHNEAKTIEDLIDKLLSFNLFDEFIAITDGTTDNSLKILKDYSDKGIITWLNYKINRGKGFALAKGVEKTKADIVVFFDTDQFKIEKKNLQKMIDPLKKGKADCIIGFLCQGPGTEEAAIFRHVCGNRSYYKKDLVPLLKQMEEKRRGIELFLNYELEKKGKKIILTPLYGLKQYYKHFKRTPDEALIDYVREGYELAVEYARQQHVEASKQTEFIKTQMLGFLRNYARLFKLSTKMLENLITDFLDNL